MLENVVVVAVRVVLASEMELLTNLVSHLAPKWPQGGPMGTCGYCGANIVQKSKENAERRRHVPRGALC